MSHGSSPAPKRRARSHTFHLPREFDEEHQNAVSRASKDSVDTCPESEIPLLSWEQAQRIQEVADVEQRAPKDDERSAITTHAPKSFRWVHHFSETHMSMPIVDGDVSSVYPGITNRDIKRDVHCVARFFPQHMHDELAEYLVKTLAGEFVEKTVFTWHSLPEFNFIVQIEFHKVIRYVNADGRLTCVQLGETRDVTRAMRDHEELVSGIISRHRESIDHRFGNKIRMMHLLCQSAPTDAVSTELSRHFERLTYEIEIRRNLFSNLPDVSPVAFDDFISEEFIKLDVSGLTRHRLLFYDLDLEPISPIVIQVLLLQDIASNAFKHGDGRVLCQLQKNAVRISNKAKRDFETLSNKAPRKRIGLDTLRTVSKQIRVGITFEKRAEEFVATLMFGKLDVFSPVVKPTPTAPTRDLSSTRADSYSWVVLDDELTICRLYQLLMKKRLNVDATIIQTPADVSNTPKIIVDLHRRTRRPVVLIMDEQLVELDDNFYPKCVSGTDLRTRFLALAPVATLIQARQLFLFSSSASQVHDNRVLLKLGKTGSDASRRYSHVRHRRPSKEDPACSRDVEAAMQFYTLLGLEEERRFRAGPASATITSLSSTRSQARAAWLLGSGLRLELIEVPAVFDPQRRAADLLNDVTSLGLNHVALDVTNASARADSLGDFLQELNDDSERLFQRSLKLVLPPYQQMIGQDVFELAFVHDADGVLLELLRWQARIPNPMKPDW
ncbi:hypothetical protein CTAYLR_006422 [Chrysophaeum taylorii]|uniref:Uncharacterized protein n=1 Tax=Chrysophaeum taylorii TaxID=2483200 RepID=A0AAD7UAH7_9STRA|nr:hypothetical protein CTAYLR_006422 [Chrysophaeum taylorii]